MGTIIDGQRHTSPASAEKPRPRTRMDQAHNPDHNRGHAIEHIGSEADRAAKTITPKLCRIDAGSNSNGTPMRLAILKMNIEPTMALAMPPPASPTGFGV